jgi:predicted dehydrogenase
MTNNKLRVGIAGYGVVGKRRRLCIDLHPLLQTVAVCDRSFPGDGQMDDGTKYYTNYEKLLEEKLDVLFVCLTNDIAAEVTIAGLACGLHVFCEKPPGRDLHDIAQVIFYERENPGLKLKYGFNHRYHDSVRDALKIAAGGELGEVINLKGVYGKSAIINFESDWRTKRSIAGGGILLDQGIHLVDLLRLFSGDFEEIHSFVSNSYWHHDVEDNVYAMMRSKAGVVAMLHSSATQWRHRFRLDITLQKGAIILSGFLSGSKSYGAETMTVAWATEHDQGNPKEQTTHYNNDPSWADEVSEFAQCIADDTPVVYGSSEEALKTMHLVYRIYCADTAWRDQWDLDDTFPIFGETNE